ncbi:hypothetical protein JTB14_019319 [Gonioctena quinquepunctata]|nr:hypothetical protein JTB14_019319 [Gonioctena quinquepunctata]
MFTDTLIVINPVELKACIQADEEKVISAAIEKSDSSPVTVVGEDVAVRFLAKTHPQRDIFLVKPGKVEVCTATYPSQEMHQLGLEHLLFMHDFTSCGTTSAAFRRSRVNFAKLYKKDRSIEEATEVFTSPSSTPEVERAGNNCILRWYGVILG